MVTKWLLPFLGKMKSDESNKKEFFRDGLFRKCHCMIDESTLTPEQRLGLKQAEERLRKRSHLSTWKSILYCFSYLEESACSTKYSSFYFLTVFLRQRYHSFSLASSFFSSFLPLFCSICSANPFICESWLHSFIPGAWQTMAYRLVLFSKIVVKYLMFLGTVLLAHSRVILIIYGCFLAPMTELSFEYLLQCIWITKHKILYSLPKA